MTSERPRISVVIPVFNEEGCLAELHRRLAAVLDGMEGGAEIVFVDDGSSDRSAAILRELSAADPRVGALRFCRNFGQHYAMTAGFDHCRGEIVVLMDADLQDRPEEIPRLLAKMEEGYDVVYAVRHTRHDPLTRRLASRLLVALLRTSAGEHMEWELATFRAMRRPVVDAMCSMRERSRFIAGLVSWLGFPSAHVEVEHEERHAGGSKYRLRSLLRLAAHAVTGFSNKPLRLATYLGFLVSVASFVWGLVLIWQRMILAIDVPGYTSIVVTVLFMGGVQLMVLGILGEYLGRVFNEVRHRPLYVVAERLGTLSGAEPA